MPQTYPINLTMFDGGLNLRASEFGLGDNESPELLNVEVDPSGGVQTRRGWQRWNSAPITGVGWNPRNAFVHELASGGDILLVASGGSVFSSASGAFTQLTGVVANTAPHGADFAPWGDDLYIACGNNSTARFNGVSTTTLMSDAAQQWSNDYLAPSTDRFPRAKLVAAHGGRMWCAGTYENGVAHPYRVRFSHTNAPGAWAQNDFIDILEGGGPVTAIVPLRDHLLVFKKGSVWAIYGYTAESLQVANVSFTVGADNRQVVARSEDSVFCVSWPQGVYQVRDGRIAEISAALRPAFRSDAFNQSAVTEHWLGWVGQRLWWSAPYEPSGASFPSTAVSTFVFDPTTGAWTLFQSGDGSTVGPFAASSAGQASVGAFGFHRATANVVELDVSSRAVDVVDGSDLDFRSYYATRWLHGGWPELKKRWKRPTVIARQAPSPYRMEISVFRDFDESEPSRKFGLSVGQAGDGATYDGGFLYDTGETYGQEQTSSGLLRASSLGSSAAVKLRFEGELGVPWGIDGVVVKYQPRRFR